VLLRQDGSKRLLSRWVVDEPTLSCGEEGEGDSHPAVVNWAIAQRERSGRLDQDVRVSMLLRCLYQPWRCHSHRSKVLRSSFAPHVHQQVRDTACNFQPGARSGLRFIRHTQASKGVVSPLVAADRLIESASALAAKGGSPWINIVVLIPLAVFALYAFYWIWFRSGKKR
jgi:hypothetical protein